MIAISGVGVGVQANYNTITLSVAIVIKINLQIIKRKSDISTNWNIREKIENNDSTLV